MALNSRKVFIFIALTAVFSIVEQDFILEGDRADSLLRIFFLMWTPGFVAILCAFFFDKSLEDLALRAGTAKSYIAAAFIPILAAILMVVLPVFTGTAEFQFDPKTFSKWNHGESPIFTGLLLAVAIPVAAFASALGEEIGWRGYLHSKLLSLAPRVRYLLTGLIWSVWHWPLLILGYYHLSLHPWLNIACFTAALTSFGFLLGYLRDISNSSVPAAVAHAGHNLWVLGAAALFLKAGPESSIYDGETGVFCAGIYLVIAGMIFFKAKKEAPL